ncbi:hypothetical protein ACV334_34135, partial [Pseudomonas aeruginosa]
VDAIHQQLSILAQSALTNLKLSSPKVDTVFDNLIASVHRNLLHSSGLCHSLNRRLNLPDRWDSNERVT